MNFAPKLSHQVASLESAMADTYFGLQVLEVEGQSPFEAQLDTQDLGWFRVTQGYLSANKYRSKLMNVSTLHPRQYILQFTQTGSMRFVGPGLDIDCGPDTFVLLGPTRHFEVEQAGPARCISIALPGGLLRAQIRDIDTRCFNVISASAGAGAVLRRLMLEIWAQRDLLTREDSKEISGSIVSLLRLVMPAKSANTSAAVTAFTAKVQELEAVIERNLDREDLTPDLVAREMAISKSYLFTLAARYGTTIRKLIMDKRLERCRAALLDPAMADVSLTEIAFGWGFQDMSHFSRRFSERYGTCPSEFRKQVTTAVAVSSEKHEMAHA